MITLRKLEEIAARLTYRDNAWHVTLPNGLGTAFTPNLFDAQAAVEAIVFPSTKRGF
jgi:hypothetical protein